MGKRKKYNFNRGYHSYDQVPTIIPRRLPLKEGQRLIRVFVEGYEDVAFWRGVFDDYESEKLTFEISVPQRDDLAKGKKIVLRMAEHNEDPYSIFCLDSDFDYLFSDQTEIARMINTRPNIFHTYAYSAENYLCYAPSLHNICVKATKNDTRIFDFDSFLKEYSKIIYELFVWYAYSAQIDTPSIFPLLDFKSAVKINYLDMSDNGMSTLEWVRRNVNQRLSSLNNKHPEISRQFPGFKHMLKSRGVSPDNTYLFIQGHTLMDNAVMPILETVCDKLKFMSTSIINGSNRQGVTLSNELSNYNNSLQDVRQALAFDENYKNCFLYKRLKNDIETYLHNLGYDEFEVRL